MNVHRRLTLVWMMGMLVFFSACNNAKKPKPEMPSQSLKVIESVDSGSLSLADFTLLVPDGWLQEEPANSMRIAQYGLKESVDFKVVISYFGDVESQEDENIKRWEAQFSSLRETEKLRLKHAALTAVKLTGTYKLKPFPMAQKFEERADYGMLAAIIPSSKGPYFIKLVAPSSIIEGEETNFKQILNSYSQQ